MGFALLYCAIAAGRDTDIAGLQLRADQGDPRAQTELGLWYHETGDYAECAEWMLKAANQGHAGAQLAYGFMALNGEGMPADEVLAAQWIRRAADQGVSTAQDILSTLYSLGAGVPQDDAAALEWATRAAEQGDPDGQFHAGFYLCCKMPSTIAHDEVTAVMWFTLSSKAGHPKSGAFLEGIGAGLSDAEKAEVNRRVDDWLRTHRQQAYRGGGR
jgi:TPR repeat protein